MTRPTCPLCGDRLVRQLAQTTRCEWCWWAGVYGVTVSALREAVAQARASWAETHG